MTTDTPVVLVVEDEPNLADLYAEWLADEYELRTAYDGEHALDLLDASIDIVLLDRRMPGLSGDAVLDRIRTRNLGCRVAMVTAVEPDFDIIDLGFDNYVTKPVSKADLHDVVEGLLTRATYDQTVQDYYALVVKRAALEAEKSASELVDDDRYGTLLSRVRECEAELERGDDIFDATDYEAAFRDLG